MNKLAKIGTVKRPVFLSILFLLIVIGNSQASQVLIGNWGDAMVQEYWEEGIPYYCIANGLDKAIVARLSGKRYYFPGPTAIPKFQPIEDEVLSLQLDIPAGEIRHLNISNFMRLKREKNQFISFSGCPKQERCLGGSFFPPQPPPDNPRGKIITSGQLNSGGGHNPIYQKLWMQHDAMEYESEQIIEIDLMVKENTNQVIFYKKKVQSPLPETMIIEKIICETLPIKETDEKIVIDTNNPKKLREVHKVKLYFKAPKVIKPTFVSFDGFHGIETLSGESLRRGIVVSPHHLPIMDSK